MTQLDSKLSLYIPRITPDWADEDAIAEQFHNQDVGYVERVDLIHKVGTNGKEYFQAFIHFDHWYETSVAYNIQERINDADSNRQARLVYDDPWYWMLLRNTKPRTEAERRLEARILILEKALADSTANMYGWAAKQFESVEINIDSLKCRLYDLELENQAVLHSDFAVEGGLDENKESEPQPEWDDVSTRPLPNTASDKPKYSPISFDTVDDDREINAWENKHRITPDAPPPLYAPYRSLSELERHSAECRRVVDEYLGRPHNPADDWCDP